MFQIFYKKIYFFIKKKPLLSFLSVCFRFLKKPFYQKNLLWLYDFKMKAIRISFSQNLYFFKNVTHEQVKNHLFKKKKVIFMSSKQTEIAFFLTHNLFLSWNKRIWVQFTSNDTASIQPRILKQSFKLQHQHNNNNNNNNYSFINNVQNLVDALQQKNKKLYPLKKMIFLQH